MSSGYACPVCDAPQRDGKHLANHLAFTAMLRAEEHEAWLDDRVPDWSEAGPDELAERVVEFAEEAEYDEVFEDTAARGAAGGRGGPGDTVHDHDHDHGAERGRPSVDAAASRNRGGAGSQGQLSGEAAAAVEEAREMTRRMYEGEEGGTSDGESVVEPDGTVDDGTAGSESEAGEGGRSGAGGGGDGATDDGGGGETTVDGGDAEAADDEGQES